MKRLSRRDFLAAGAATALAACHSSAAQRAQTGMTAQVSIKHSQRLVREGDLVAEVEVQLLEDSNGWAPYLSLDDACRLDDVRAALRAGDLARAARLASRVYRLTPIEA